MAFDLSIIIPIIIPTEENLYEKYYFSINGGGKVFADGNKSLWGTAIYELWDGDEIYSDVFERLKDLTVELECSEYHEDFSKKTQDELEAEKMRVIEGVKFLQKLGHPTGGLYHDLELCLDAAERYVNKKIRIEKTVELVYNLEIRIKQLQVDIQTGVSGEIEMFKKEMKEIKQEIKFLKNFGANEKEMKRLQCLFNDAETDFSELKAR